MGANYTIPAQCKAPNNPADYVKNAVSTLNGYAEIYANATTGSNDATLLQQQQLNAMYKSLTKQKQDLTKQIQSLKSSTERHDRDFVELEQSTSPNTSSIHVLDDYTLWTLLLSYILFAVAICFWYSHIHLYSISSILMSVGGMTLVSFFLIVLGIIIL
jgi:Ca2+-dependent lipid-binding protein